MTEFELLRIRLRFEHDVVIARQRAREAAGLLGFRAQEQTRIATAVSELARRAFRTRGEGRVDFALENGDPGILRIEIHFGEGGDVGEGTRVTAERLIDRVEVDGDDGGAGRTVVRLDQHLPRGERPGPARVEEIRGELRDRSPENPFEELQLQNQELLEAMERLQEQERELNRLLEAEREAREEAQRAVQDREEVLSIVSHDLRNPIGAIETGVRFLLEEGGGLDPEVRERHLGAILRSADRANRLIGDLLDLTSLDRGVLSIECTETPVDDLLREAEELMSARASEAGACLDIDREGARGLPPACADRDRVVQALGNLLSNAIRFSPEGGRISVSASVVGGDRIRFSVSDQGPGVPDDQVGKLFERFWSDESREGGAGLGLSIVRGIAEGHGGRAWTDPDAGAGATFHFTVPTAGAGCPGTPSEGAEGAS